MTSRSVIVFKLCSDRHVRIVHFSNDGDILNHVNFHNTVRFVIFRDIARYVISYHQDVVTRTCIQELSLVGYFFSD